MKEKRKSNNVGDNPREHKDRPERCALQLKISEQAKRNVLNNGGYNRRNNSELEKTLLWMAKGKIWKRG